MKQESTCKKSDFFKTINKDQVQIKLIAFKLQALNFTEACFLPKTSRQPKKCSKNRFLYVLHKQVSICNIYNSHTTN